MGRGFGNRFSTCEVDRPTRRQGHKAAVEQAVGRETMQLRHIRPGSVDWNDALNEGKEDEEARLSPDQVQKLRSLLAPERLPEKTEPQGNN
jgi:hypothetical protein